MVNDYELVDFLDALASRNSTPSGVAPRPSWAPWPCP